MTLSINSKTYTADAFASDAVGYVGVANTLTVKDRVVLQRTAPKTSATFSGVGRARAKMTRTLTLTGALTPTADAILDISSQIPVGFAGADVDTMCNDLGAYIASASFKALVKSLQISY